MGSKPSRTKRQQPDDVYDTYITRWDFFPTHSAFFQGPAGTVVTAFRFHPKVHYTAHETKETRVLEDLVYVVGNNGRKGLIPVIFLQLFNKIGRPSSVLGAVIEQYAFRKEIIESKWYVAHLSFAEVSIYMAENLVEAGSWFICNPQETDPTSDRWPDYWLAIRTYDGFPHRMVEIFENSLKWNRKLAEKCSLEPRKSKFVRDVADGEEVGENHKADNEYGLKKLWKKSTMGSAEETHEFLLDLIENYLNQDKDVRNEAKDPTQTVPFASRDAEGNSDSDSGEAKALPFGRLVKLANKASSIASTPGKALNDARKPAGMDPALKTGMPFPVKNEKPTKEDTQEMKPSKEELSEKSMAEAPTMRSRESSKSRKKNQKLAKEKVSTKSVKPSPMARTAGLATEKAKKESSKRKKEGDERKLEERTDKVQLGKIMNQSPHKPTGTPLESITTNDPAKPKDLEPTAIKTTVDSMKKLVSDSLPATLDPPPPVIFLRISRTTTGRFYLFKPHDESFPTIYHLLNAYIGHSLPLDTNFQVILGEPIRYHEHEQIGIVPIGLPIPAPVHPVLRCIGLVNSPAPLWKEKKADLESNGPLNVAPYQSNVSVYTFVYTAKETRKIGVCSPLGESYFGKVQAGQKTFKSVIKYLKDDYINHEQFLRDVMKLHLNTRIRQGFVKQGDHIYNPTGINFLAKINGFDIVSAKKWVAFAHAGLYSVPEVMKLWNDEGKSLYWRGKIEIVYQIAAAMRHLEQNGLCHRALKASNVIVKEAGDFNWRVVVTDFLLPYTFLVNSSKKPNDYTCFHWRWMAPESLEKSQFDIVSDVWAFGCTIFEVVTWGKEPWSFDNDIKNPVDVLEKIKKEKIMNFGHEKRQVIPYYLKNLIGICMDKAEKERPSFHKLYSYLNILLYDATKPMERTVYENMISLNKEIPETGNIPTAEIAGK